jgi:hypothetical protein
MSEKYFSPCTIVYVPEYSVNAYFQFISKLTYFNCNFDIVSHFSVFQGCAPALFMENNVIFNILYHKNAPKQPLKRRLGASYYFHIW